ncbi:hypothetical protein ACX0G7_17405 [Flavitalea antarctica]
MFRTAAKRVLFLSFLHALKKRDFKAFVFVIVCILFQLFFTFVKLEFTPFFLFGMYSEQFTGSDTLSKIVLLVNDKPIEFYKPTPGEKSLLETNTINYVDMKRNNNTDLLKTRIESRYPFIYESVLYPYFAQRIYNTPQTQQQFKDWLKKKCSRLAGSEKVVVRIIELTYVLNRATIDPNLTKNETLEVL